MELSVAITLVCGLVFIGLIGYKTFKSYSFVELEKENLKRKEVENQTINLLKQKLGDTQNVLAQTRYKLKKFRNNYDLDFDEDELEEIGEDDNLQISELAKIVYPKLPPALGELLDKEEFQNAIIKTVDKKPDLLTHFIDKYLNKPEAQSDNSNSKLANQYL